MKEFSPPILATEHPVRPHRLETISGERQVDGKLVRLSVQLFDTLPLNGNHHGTIVSAPGLGAHPEAKDTLEMRHRLNLLDFGAVDWYETPWGNRIGPFGRDQSLENTRALLCHDLVIEEIIKRSNERGVTPDIHSMGWSRSAGIAAADAGQNYSRLKTLSLVLPGFMKDTSWTAAKRYLTGRAADAIKGVRRKGITHLREFVPFLKAGFSNPHRMIHRGGAAAGWAPIPEMFTASLAGVPITVIQGERDETFPPDVVQNNIEKGYVELYDALLSNEGTTVFEGSRTLEELMPKFVRVPGGHGIGSPEEAAEILVTQVKNMQQNRNANTNY